MAQTRILLVWNGTELIADSDINKSGIRNMIIRLGSVGYFLLPFVFFFFLSFFFPLLASFLSTQNACKLRMLGSAQAQPKLAGGVSRAHQSPFLFETGPMCSSKSKL